MTYYTNNKLKNTENLKGTATIKIHENLKGKFSGHAINKGTKIVISDAQYDTLMSVIDDGNCEWDLIVDTDNTTRDQFTLSYLESKTNFSLESINC